MFSDSDSLEPDSIMTGNDWMGIKFIKTNKIWDQVIINNTKLLMKITYIIKLFLRYNSNNLVDMKDYLPVNLIFW